LIWGLLLLLLLLKRIRSSVWDDKSCTWTERVFVVICFAEEKGENVKVGLKGKERVVGFDARDKTDV